MKDEQSKVTLEQAVSVLTNALKTDPELRLAWVSGIAMAFKDTFDQHRRKVGRSVANNDNIHLVANEAAEHFLNMIADDEIPQSDTYGPGTENPDETQQPAGGAVNDPGGLNINVNNETINLKL